MKQQLKTLEEELEAVKHAAHDQSSHGNWASGGGGASGSEGRRVLVQASTPEGWKKRKKLGAAANEGEVELVKVQGAWKVSISEGTQDNKIRVNLFKRQAKGWQVREGQGFPASNMHLGDAIHTGQRWLDYAPGG